MVTTISCRTHAVIQVCAHAIADCGLRGKFIRGNELYAFSRSNKVDDSPRVAACVGEIRLRIPAKFVFSHELVIHFNV